MRAALDANLIPGIYNYCHRRCDRCPFTTRCLVFREEQEQRAPERAAQEHQARDDRGVSDALQLTATRYAQTACEVVEPLHQLSAFHEWPPEVAGAIETIGWYAGFIAAKAHRALHASGNPIDGEDAIQNDGNGSAKAARLAIGESIAAWETLFAAGDTPPGAQIRETVDLLGAMDRDIAVRFPRAMEFVRPGFDEPDVAAGAPTTARWRSCWSCRSWTTRILRFARFFRRV